MMMNQMRLRSSPLMRNLCDESTFSIHQLIQPLFVGETVKEDVELPGLLGTKRQSIESVLSQIESDQKAGVTQFILFNIPEHKKDRQFSHDFSTKVISSIKKRFGSDIQLWVDTCLCSLTTHGHCGVFCKDSFHFSLEETLEELATLSLSYAQSGADGVSPSDMMDGRVKAMREKLNHHHYSHIPIMSYSTKFSSSFYGPFRIAADSAPKNKSSGFPTDRKTYQIDVRNRTDAIQSSIRCANEGADLLMVKPGMTSIDLIREIKEKTGKQVGAYQVSGEYASLVFLAKNQLVDLGEAMKESFQVFRRAGSQYIITYGARFAKEWNVFEK